MTLSELTREWLKLGIETMGVRHHSGEWTAVCRGEFGIAGAIGASSPLEAITLAVEDYRERVARTLAGATALEVQ